jgi:hypothetical protein
MDVRDGDPVEGEPARLDGRAEIVVELGERLRLLVHEARRHHDHASASSSRTTASTSGLVHSIGRFVWFW